MIEKLNSLSIRVKNIEGKLSNKSSSSSTSATLSHNHLKILNKYFQIDEKEKLLNTVEEKLKNDKFYTLVVSIRNKFYNKVNLNKFVTYILEKLGKCYMYDKMTPPLLITHFDT